jgi:predicted aspartyl protease
LRRRLDVELLEARLALSAATITLDPFNDEFGSQIQTVTQFGNSNRVTFGLLDTGASPITVAQADQASFADAAGNPDPIPIKVAGGASGDGIGGGVTGDVSQPVTVLTDGLHAASLNIDANLNVTITANFGATSARVAGIQAFVGTTDGSPDLPTISGTPVFAGGFNSASTSKLAAKVDLINGVDLYGLGLLEPDVHFVAATSTLTPGPKEQRVTIPLTTIGSSNVSKPVNNISSYYNFVSNNVELDLGAAKVAQQHFLLDTGSQLTIISTAEAKALKIDLAHPFDSIDVQGVGGTLTVNGYVIDSLKIGLGGSNVLTVKNVPVFVLDVAPGIDGILGMNLWDNVDQMLIDPFTPQGKITIPTLSLTWDPSYTGGGSSGGFGFLLMPSSGAHGPETLQQLLGDIARTVRLPAETTSRTGSTPLPAQAAPASAASAADASAATVAPAQLPASALPPQVVLPGSPVGQQPLVTGVHSAASAVVLPAVATPAAATALPTLAGAGRGTAADDPEPIGLPADRPAPGLNGDIPFEIAPFDGLLAESSTPPAVSDAPLVTPEERGSTSALLSAAALIGGYWLLGSNASRGVADKRQRRLS